MNVNFTCFLWSGLGLYYHWQALHSKTHYYCFRRVESSSKTFIIVLGAKVLSPTYIVKWIEPTKLSWGFHLIKRLNAIEQVHLHLILSYVCDMFHNLLW